MESTIYLQQLDKFLPVSLLERPEFENYFKYPCLNDDTPVTGFDTHYVYHIAWAIRKLIADPPAQHVDIASSVHFCSAVCGVTPTTFFDYRPASLKIPNLLCLEGDLTDDSQWLGRLFPSVSCMHVVEHIGLGRYGDSIDVNGDLVAMRNLRRIVKPGGRLLFVVPIGKPAIYFNAHRIYSAEWILNFFSPNFKLNEFYFIPGPAELSPKLNCDFRETERFDYGCGCFEFKANN